MLSAWRVYIEETVALNAPLTPCTCFHVLEISAALISIFRWQCPRRAERAEMRPVFT